jgi:iron complex outermembrane receptor protein
MKSQSTITIFHKTRCATAVAAVVVALASQGANAQQAPAESPVASAETPAMVVVSGTRMSVMSAIERKKAAGTVTDSIVAEDIGQFPDKNVGEALSRITGVQLSRESGEGNQIAIRGVEPDLNRVEINGASVLSTNNTAGRGADLRELPAELIKSIDVYKGITADLTEGGIGGTVSVKTNRPLDFKKFTAAVNVSGQQNNLRGGVQPRASLLIAERFLNGDLGLMANVTFDQAYTQSDGVRNTGWRFIRDWDFSPEKTVTSTVPKAAGVTSKAGCSTLTGADRTACDRQWFDYSPSVPRYGISTRDNERKSGEFTAQYRVSKELSVLGSYQRNKQEARFQDLTYGTDFADANRLSNSGTLPRYNANGSIAANGTCTPASTTATPAGMVVTNHHVTEYTVGNCVAVSGQGGYNAFSTSARDFMQTVDSDYRTAGFNWRKGQWEAEGLVVKSKAAYENDTNFIGLTMNAPGLKVKLDADGRPHFEFPANANPDNASSYTRAELNYRPTESESKEDQAKLDLRYRPDSGFIKKIWVGGQGRKTRMFQYNGGGYLLNNGSNLASTADDLDVKSANVTQLRNYDPLYTGIGQRPAVVQSFINSNNSETWISSQQMQEFVNAVRSTSPAFLQEAGVSGYPANWIAPDYQAGAPFFDTSRFNHDEVRQALGRDGNIYPQVPAYDTEERIRSAYLRLDFEHQLFGYDIDGNVGLRYTGTETKSTGLQQYRRRIERSAGSATFDDRVITNSIVTKDNKYHDVLPSFNAATWLVPDELAVRIGYGKVMSRPAINRLAPAINCLENGGNTQFGGDGFDDCSAGNPELKPYRAANKDVSVEWYPNRDTQLSVAYFRKDIQTSIQPNFVVRKDLFGDGKLWDVNTTVNYAGATTKGIELAGRTAFTFLPGFLSGLGVDANYTRMNFKYASGAEVLNTLDGSVLPFAGMSKNSYNLSIWYDKHKVNARLAYNYRDPYYTGGNDINTGNPVFMEETGYLDAKVQYRVTPNLIVSVEAKNLTDEVSQTTAGSSERKNDFVWNSRRYYVGASYKF